MNLTTIDMPRAEARTKYVEYRDAVRARHDDELAEIARGYRALSKGQQVIDLSETIKAGGSGADDRPRLAVARASAEWCWLERIDRNGSGRFCTVDPSTISMHNRADRVGFPEGTCPERELPYRPWGSEGRVRAMVPIVPPSLRPKHSLAGYHVLFEVEKWQRVPRPPGDPALLKAIGGDLYAVLATWDLTELERAVLNRRNRR